MNHIHPIRRLAVLPAGLAAVLMPGASSPAATLALSGPSGSDHATLHEVSEAA